ncbi:hypothetical protein AVEN_249712-1 [Araneus ventricosus]|uniref:Uncharacterized protein n=1 Tax=Araneus ventricosus TaxID=182803 RepID=A0A4Y2R3V3_ARAVE|nr:hypothetical protein AVEN_249712-1 [Araneus ventricosus]
MYLVVPLSVVFRVIVISKMFQSEIINVSSAVEMINKTRQVMVEMRLDKRFQQAVVDVYDLCDSIQIDTKCSQEPEVQSLKEKK